MKEENLQNKNQQEELNSSAQQVSELQACQESLAEWKNKFLIVTADFQNFRKRMEKEQAQWARSAQIRVIEPLLTVIDNFERALTQSNVNTAQDLKKYQEGFALIYNDLQQLLSKLRVIRMNNYETFDPHYHEALLYVESQEKPSGSIVEVLQQGYTLDGEIVRIAKVSVAR